MDPPEAGRVIANWLANWITVFQKTSGGDIPLEFHLVYDTAEYCLKGKFEDDGYELWEQSFAHMAVLPEPLENKLGDPNYAHYFAQALAQGMGASLLLAYPKPGNHVDKFQALLHRAIKFADIHFRELPMMFVILYKFVYPTVNRHLKE